MSIQIQSLMPISLQVPHRERGWGWGLSIYQSALDCFVTIREFEVHFKRLKNVFDTFTSDQNEKSNKKFYHHLLTIEIF